MSTSVYVLFRIEPEDGEHYEAFQIFGVYRSEADAQAAIPRSKAFDDDPCSFHIDRYDLDQDHWEDGFILDED